MTIYVDIDETICRTPRSRDYHKSRPIKKNIEKINKYYDQNHYIVYWTSRGMSTGLDWRKFTEKQLAKWGAKYDELRFEKPLYDILIDDKAFKIGCM